MVHRREGVVGALTEGLVCLWQKVFIDEVLYSVHIILYIDFTKRYDILAYKSFLYKNGVAYINLLIYI